MTRSHYQAPKIQFRVNKRNTFPVNIFLNALFTISVRLIQIDQTEIIISYAVWRKVTLSAIMHI